MAEDSASSIRSRPGRRISILLTSHDHAHHHSLMSELVHRAHSSKMAGATVFQAQEGYGASGLLHRRHLLSDDAPVTVVIVDEPDKVDSFLNSVEDLLTSELVVIDDLDIIDV